MIIQACLPFFRRILRHTTPYTLLFISLMVGFGVLKTLAIATNRVIVGNALDWVIGVAIAISYVSNKWII